MGERGVENGNLEKAISLHSDAGGDNEITLGGLRSKRLDSPSRSRDNAGVNSMSSFQLEIEKVSEP